MKIVTVIGARPQFIKAGPVSRAIQEHNQCEGDPEITEVIVHFLAKGTRKLWEERGEAACHLLSPDLMEVA